MDGALAWPRLTLPQGVVDILKGLDSGTHAKQPAVRQVMANRWHKLDFLKQPHTDLDVVIGPPSGTLLLGAAGGPDSTTRSSVSIGAGSPVPRPNDGGPIE